MMELTIWVACLSLLLFGALAAFATLELLSRLGPRDEGPFLATTLIVPLTGHVPRLGDLLTLIGRQTWRPARVLLVVESRDDPAYLRACAELRESDLHGEVLIAGGAEGCTQKCHNLAHALARTELLEDCVVLADADIAPGSTWLAELVGPLGRGSTDIVSGYRWIVPAKASPAAMTGAWIDWGIAVLPRLHCFNLLWGGSLAARRETLARIDAKGALRRAVTDDLALADAGQAARVRVFFKDGILVPTPVTYDCRSLFAFGRRQYQLIRLYRPLLWWVALVIAALNVLAGFVVLTAAIAGDTIAFAAWLGSVALALLAYTARREIGRRVGAVTVSWANRAMWAAPFVLPAIHLVHLLAVLGGRDTRKIVWSHCTYSICAGEVRSILRVPWPEQS